tara:strand:+ start:4529 stop:5497 length:969 start_codon:yes stop_codon:yes gene_type:complete
MAVNDNNKRVFYASQGVAVGPATGVATTITGAQSVTMNTNFNLEQVFQLGQLAVYDNVVGDPSVEVSISKVLDGQKTLYNLGTGGGGSLVATSSKESQIVFVVGNDTLENIGDNNDTSALDQDTARITCNPIYLQSLNYNFAVDGDFTEEATFVGLSKAIGTGTLGTPASGSTVRQTVFRRQNFNQDGSVLPSAVSGQSVQSISISADLGRESMYKLGRFKEFHRYVNFPLEISVDFEVIAKSLDTTAIDVPDVSCSGLTLPKEPITLQFCNSTGLPTYTFSLSNATLTSVAFGGGDTGGGNSTLTFSYVVYNSFTPADGLF